MRSLIVVDFGTATTFDYLSGRGEYLGGAIAGDSWPSSVWKAAPRVYSWYWPWRHPDRTR